MHRSAPDEQRINRQQPARPFVERKSTAPIVPTDLFAAPAFRFSAIASVCCFTGQTLGVIALPFYLQHGLGMTATEAGLYMMPWPAAVAVIAPISGRLADQMKTAWLCAVGGILLAIGLIGVGLLPDDPHHVAFIVGTVVAGLGFGLFQTPNNRTMIAAAPRERTGGASGMLGTARLLGQTTGAAIVALLFARLPHQGPTVALFLACGCALVATAVSLARLYETPALAAGRSSNPEADSGMHSDVLREQNKMP